MLQGRTAPFGDGERFCPHTFPWMTIRRVIADVVGEIVSTIVGDGIAELLFPGRSNDQSPPREGEWNASLGSLGAFLAVIALMFCGLASRGVLAGLANAWVWLMLGGSVIVAMVAGFLAHRALEVTSRRRGLARFGVWLSRATIWVGILAAALSLAGIRVTSL